MAALCTSPHPKNSGGPEDADRGWRKLTLKELAKTRKRVN
jgi:hypothetical protein